MYSVFSPCPRGLETQLSIELDALGMTELTAVDGGVNGQGDAKQIAMANLWSRTATRITVELGRAEAGSANDLYKLGRSIAWGDWFSASSSIRIDTTVDSLVNCSREFATLKLKDAIADHFRVLVGARPSIDKSNPDVRLRLHWARGQARILVDTSGEPLFKRGWRKSTGDAPLRENLAAGMLLIAGYDGSQCLLDPMCGSGTLLVEAADIAMNRPPGRLRSFAYPRLLPFANAEADAFTANNASPVIIGNDRDPQALRSARENLNQVGLKNISLSSVNVTELEAPAESGILISNPPYGERLDSLAEITAQYPAWGQWLKNNFAGWDCYWLTADRQLPKGMRLSAKRKTPLFNGALDCRLFYIPMVSGSAREL